MFGQSPLVWHWTQACVVMLHVWVFGQLASPRHSTQTPPEQWGVGFEQSPSVLHALGGAPPVLVVPPPPPEAPPAPAVDVPPVEVDPPPAVETPPDDRGTPPLPTEPPFAVVPPPATDASEPPAPLPPPAPVTPLAVLDVVSSLQLEVIAAASIATQTVERAKCRVMIFSVDGGAKTP